MSVVKGVYSRLTTDTEITELVGARVYPHLAPQTSGPQQPTIVYSVEQNEYGRTYAGGDGLADALVFITCVAGKYADAVELSKRVRARLDNQEGTWGGVVVAGCFHTDETEDSDTPEGVNEHPFYLIDQTYSVFWRTV